MDGAPVACPSLCRDRSPPVPRPEPRVSADIPQPHPSPLSRAQWSLTMVSRRLTPGVIFCRLFITHGNARSPDCTDELVANFTATAPDYPVCRIPDDNAVTGKDQHKLIGNVKIDIELRAR